MSWKDDLLELKRQERWMDIIVSCEQQIQKDNNSADSYIQTIYLTHDILLEEYPTSQEEQEAQRLLIHTFSDGQQRHWDNAEYLFFIGSLVPIAEWLFGLKESSKPLEKRIGYEMVKKATLLDPHNLLYRWSYQDYNRDTQSKQLAQDILSDQVVVSYLRRQGYAGEYMLDILGVASTWVDD